MSTTWEPRPGCGSAIRTSRSPANTATCSSTRTRTRPSSTGRIALDVIGTDETLRTDRFEVVVAGYELTDLQCNVGHTGDVGGCELVDDGSVYRAVIEPLDPGEGITIGATIVGTRPVASVAPPPLPEKNPDRRAPLAATTSALGVLTGGGIYAWARRRGRNEVFSGGAADAAYGTRIGCPVGRRPAPGRLGDDRVRPTGRGRPVARQRAARGEVHERHRVGLVLRRRGP